MKALILGGARSGKSRYAEMCARDSTAQGLIHDDKSLVYIATGSAGDKEMAARIKHHQLSRGDDWFLIEEPVNLAEALEQVNSEKYVIVIDCLTLWITNCLCEGDFDRYRSDFLASLATHRGDVFIVSNEVGSGIVPLGELSREFVDQSGWLNQELANICDRVSLIVAGLPLHLKG